MIECVILFRSSEDKIDYLADPKGGMKVFPDHDAAITAAKASPDCRAFPYKTARRTAVFRRQVNAPHTNTARKCDRVINRFYEQTLCGT